MVAIPDSVREFLTTGPLGHVVTLGPDGTPHVSLAWAGFQGDQLVFATVFNVEQHKIRNLRRDPRVTISFQANEFDGQGLYPYLVIRGRADITEGGALEVMDWLSEIYIGPGEKFFVRETPPGVVVRVDVEKFYGVGPWRDGPTADEE